MWFDPKEMLKMMIKQRIACFFGFHDKGADKQAPACLFCQKPLRRGSGQVIPFPQKRKEQDGKTG
jgi:hypothetical protein